MGTFVTCYVLVWVAVTLYVARLGAQQRSLQQALNRLENKRAANRPSNILRPPAWPDSWLGHRSVNQADLR